MDVKSVSQGGQTTLNYSSNQNQVGSGEDINVTGQISAGNSNGPEVADEASVKKAVEKMNDLLDGNNTHVEYEVHDKFKDIMVKIVDNNTKQIISEIPSKKLLDMVAKLCEMAGLFVDQKA